MGGNRIQVDVKVIQEYEENVVESQDSYAQLLDEGVYRRLSYIDNDDIVTMDITKDTVVIQKKGEWFMHGVFSLKDESTLQIISEEGTLVFKPHILELIVEKNRIDLKYNITHSDDKVDEYRYLCSWE